MAWCEANAVDYVFGMARNVRLEKMVQEALEQARRQFEQTQQAARVFVEFQHETVSGTWSRRRRVVAKAEHIDGKSNPRFVVTSLGPEIWAAQQLYEELYCARGDMENRIKEQFVLFCRPGERGHHARQSIAAVSVRDGLLAGLRSAALGLARDPMGCCAGGHYPFAVVENRRADSSDGTQSVDPDG